MRKTEINPLGSKLASEALSEGWDATAPALVNTKLSIEAFRQLAGTLSGYPFVKVVYDREKDAVHFINHARYSFHCDYVAEHILHRALNDFLKNLDAFNQSVYLAPDRRFMLGIISLHPSFFCLETTEVDNMGPELIQPFYDSVRAWLHASMPLVFKPANHGQEAVVSEMDDQALPRVFHHELFSSADFVALHPGKASGRLRLFKSHEQYQSAFHTIEWFDILAMHRVPDDIPRVSGIINAQHTTPLSHTNVLASGWQIPNSIQIGVIEEIERQGLDGQWVEYCVKANEPKAVLKRLERPMEIPQRPGWSVQKIKLEEPEVMNTPVCALDALRMSDRFRYGTKAANLGEMRRLLEQGSQRLLGFYSVKRPPRQNLLPYLARFLGVPFASEKDLSIDLLGKKAWDFLRAEIQIPRGIAIPFALQKEFLESSPRIQQMIGKLKMALELGAREIDPLCVSLQQMIRAARMSDRIRDLIDAKIAGTLGGVSSFVVRSSSNAEDLENFSAAGIYESINHVTTADNIFQSIKEVWASLVSPRSVRLRHQVGIALDDCYMGVIVQEEVKSSLGGVLVTTNPMEAGSDFRSVYINASQKSAIEVVQGASLPYQYLYNAVEGGGRTLSLGNRREDLAEKQKAQLQKLAFIGRLLQSHFSRDYTFDAPIDIEWAINEEGIHILQLRPYTR